MGYSFTLRRVAHFSLQSSALKEDMCAYDFIGNRYDAGSKQRFLEATVETVHRRRDLRDKFLQYVIQIVKK